MKMETGDTATQAVVESLHWSRGTATAVIEVTRNGTSTPVTLRLSNVTERQAAALVSANARLMAGAIVVDGHDLDVLRIDPAPAHTASLLAAIASDSARDRLQAAS